MCCRDRKIFVAGYIILILTLALPSMTLANVIFVSGNISGTWDADTVVVVDSIRVPAGHMLVIMPGVEVFFAGYFQFYVLDDAVLHAVGTETDSIRFVPFLPGDRGLGLNFINSSSQSILEYCYISDALTSGVHLENSSITIRHCLIENCEAPSGVQGGGAIEVLNGSDAVIDGNIFRDNTSVDLGGAIYCNASSPTIRNNIIDNNLAGYALGSYGGGIALEDGSNAFIINNMIINNQAHPTGSFSIGSGAGGAIFCGDHSNAVIFGNMIFNNIVRSEPQTTSDAGAIFIGNSSPLISNNIIAGNTAEGDNGGAIEMYQSGSMIINNVFYNNTAGDTGGAFFINASPNAIIVNSILFANNADADPEIHLRNSNISVTYSDVQGSWPGQGNIDIDPLFRDPLSNDFHLTSTACGDQQDSPCIDAGDPAIHDLLLDCDHGLGTMLSDMGAYGGGDSTFVGISNPESSLPNQFGLIQNYPNPFNASTTIKYELPQQTNVIIDIHDILGRRVATIFGGVQPAGEHRAIWNASTFTTGVYFARLEVGGQSRTVKMILLK